MTSLITFRTVVLCMVLAVSALYGAAAASTQDEGLSSDQRRTLISEGQQAYDEGTALLKTDTVAARERFRTAAERFTLVADDGVVNGKLAYDTGNALFQAGQLGPAIVWYLRADRLMPGDPRLHTNLTYARSLVRPQIQPDGSGALIDRLLFWHHDLPTRWRFVAFGACWTVFWLVLALRLRRPLPAWGWIAGAALAASIALGWSVGHDTLQPSAASRGVLIADAVIVRKGNAESFSPTFDTPVNQGLEFKVLEQRPKWLFIELQNGTSGWIRRVDAQLIQPD